MKQVIYAIASAVLLLAVSCNNDAQQETKTTADAMQTAYAEKPDSATRVKRGEYLVTIMACNDCHTPKKMTDKGPMPDMDRMLSGYDASQPLPAFDTVAAKSGKWAFFCGKGTAFAGPWGVSYAANLTPDGTGIGNWTIENFKKAFREGKSKGIDAARPLLPPMPWQNYTQVKDEDVEAIFAYLKSIKPVENRVPNCIIAFEKH
ncbi:MAG: c-type cytochrome [Bacteroidetes bacterium]|nr:c-type cytochrome [Bacteroidota bacterium]